MLCNRFALHRRIAVRAYKGKAVCLCLTALPPSMHFCGEDGVVVLVDGIDDGGSDKKRLFKQLNPCLVLCSFAFGQEDDDLSV